MSKSFVSAKNKEQKQLIRSIVENPVTIVTGPPGSGKTIVSIGLALEHLLRGNCDRVIISRPLVCTGKALPALPGDMKEKLQPYWMQAHQYIVDFLKTDAAKLEKEDKIQYLPLELMRGMNLRKTYLVLTEAQNATYEQLKMLLTRIEDENSRIIIDGDLEQTDLKECHLTRVIDKIQHLEEVGLVHLVESLRHPIVEKIARLL